MIRAFGAVFFCGLCAHAQAPEEDLGVTVRAQRPREAASEVTLDAAALQAAPARSVDDLIRQVPGLLVVQHGAEGKGAEVFVRGFDALHGQDVEVLLADVPLNEPSNVHGHGYLDLAFVIPELVRGIEATKGVVRLDQGDFATAASLGLRLGVEGEERGVRLGYEAGSNFRQRALAVYAPVDRPDADVLGVELMRDNGFGEQRRARRMSVLGQWTLAEDGPSSLVGLAAIYGGWFELPAGLRREDAETKGFFASYNDATHGVSHRALTALTGKTRVGDLRLRSTLHLQLRHLTLDENFTGDLADPVHGDRHLQVHDALSGGLRLHGEAPLLPGLALRLFGQLQAHHIDQTIDGLDRGGDPFERRRDLASLRLTGALGVGLTYNPLSWLEIFGGLRGDVFREDGADEAAAGPPDPDSGEEGRIHRAFAATTGQLSPRTSVAVFIDDLRLQAAYGRGIRSPEAAAFAEEGVSPAAADSLEAGLRWEADWIDAGATAFQVTLEDERLFDHASGFSIGQGDSLRRGFELDADARPTPWLVLGASYTHTRATLNDGDPIPGVPDWFLTARAAVVRPRGLQGGLSFLQLGPRPLANEAKAGPAAVVGGRLSHRFATWSIDFEVENALDTRWREGEFNYASHWDAGTEPSSLPAIHFFPGPPRLVRLGLNVWL